MVTPVTTVPLPPRKLDFLSGVYSFFIPGLGQILQGRIGKGVLFLVCIYGLFFYGMALGEWKNVYLPNYHRDETGPSKVIADLKSRYQFIPQFFMGAAVWPSLYQYLAYDPADNANPPLSGWMREPTVDFINDHQRNADKRWDLGWVYTVIAGVLNILVIYDAVAGAAFRRVSESTNTQPTPPSPQVKS
ncbi:MAG: DUF6677 family protein [Zavarzinella sp.]